MSDQDYLKKSLVDLQAELETFKGLQETLNDARENLINAERSWSESTAANKKSIKDIIEIVSGSIASNENVTKSLAGLCKTLVPLVKSIEDVNFPLRLDKIDIAVSTHASTLSSVHTLVTHEFRMLAEKNELNLDSIEDEFDSVNASVKSISSRLRLMLSLLVVNLGLVASIVFYSFFK